MMHPFISENFLLQSDTARRLYFDHVHHLPIIDYHNHLSPEEIATDKKFESITEAWLKGDHYKWRAMRANGVPEYLITGGGDDISKFKAWAATVPFTMRNPLYHWTHLELKRPFDVLELLNEESAERIYHYCNELLQSKYSVCEILKYHRVELLCTTDSPTDDLQYHQKIASGEQQLRVLPTFRPDPLLDFFNKEQWLNQVDKLSESTQTGIHDLDSFLSGLGNRVEFFHANGCRLADHGLEYMPLHNDKQGKAEKTFAKLFKKKKQPDRDELLALKAHVLFELCKMYHSKQWAQQFHLGAMRNNNTRLFEMIGNDAGTDSIGDFSHARTLSIFLNALDKEHRLAKTILYNLNPADNEVFATLAGNFNDGSSVGKMQWGSAWWFLDQKDGIGKQLNILSNMSLLSRFIGMVTDSRSFLSFSRHDYFRRILCNLVGTDMDNGELPDDLEFTGNMVANISYHNAKNYFGWT
ncbi:MAG TPA: glucuronate isomerase [Parafilimonas sp.]|nr:glucuronate isomerase [Parafilimonas sp.]